MKTIAVVSDIHSNASIGVCPPGVTLDDGQSYQRSKVQSWLWDCWLDYCERVKQEREGELIVVVNGEAADAPYKYHSHQYVSQDKFVAREIGIRVLSCLADQADYLYVTRGTEAHVGKGSGLDNAIAADFLNVVSNPEVNQPSWYWLPLQVEGVKLDIAHHVDMGNLPWTEKNAASSLAAKVLFDMAKDERPIPNIVLRGHVHRFADSYDNYPNIRGLITGCWCFATSYVNRIKPGALAQIGGYIIKVDGKKYEVERVQYEPEAPKWSVVK